MSSSSSSSSIDHLCVKCIHCASIQSGNNVFFLMPQYLLICSTPKQSQNGSCFVSFSLLYKSSNAQTDYAELLFPQRHPKPSVTVPQNNSTQQLNRSLPEPQVDGIPPALPYRPTNLLHSPTQFPGSQSNRLYPNLKEEYPHMAAPLPVILTYKYFTLVLDYNY